MIALRSSPFSSPAINCILIVLIAPRCRCDRYQLLSHLEALQLSFFSFFPTLFSTLSKGYVTQILLLSQFGVTLLHFWELLGALLDVLF